MNRFAFSNPQKNKVGAYERAGMELAVLYVQITVQVFDGPAVPV